MAIARSGQSARVGLPLKLNHQKESAIAKQMLAICQYASACRLEIGGGVIEGLLRSPGRVLRFREDLLVCSVGPTGQRQCRLERSEVDGVLGHLVFLLSGLRPRIRMVGWDALLEQNRAN